MNRRRRRIRRQKDREVEEGKNREDVGHTEGSRVVGYSNRRRTISSKINDEESDFLQYSSEGSDLLHGDGEGFDDSEEITESDEWNSDDSSRLHSQVD